MAPTKLTYFGVTGFGEPVRLLLAYGQIDFEDERLTREQFAPRKESFPMGQVPVLEIDGHVLNQSAAICRFLARRVGLAGDNEWEAVQADIQVENFVDIRMAMAAFHSETDEAVKAERRKQAMDTKISKILSRIEEHLEKNGGHFVNGKLTWADLWFAGIYNSFNYILGSDMFESCPKLQALNRKVLALPQLQKYLSSRPPTPF